MRKLKENYTLITKAKKGKNFIKKKKKRLYIEKLQIKFNVNEEKR